jgi:hypothetical protein
MNTHENIAEVSIPSGGSDRNFGIVLSIFLIGLSLFPLLSDMPPRWWALAGGVGIAAVALISPRFLAPCNLLWHKLGLLLGAIVAPLVMAMVFLLVLTPLGIMMRAKGTDPLALRFDPQALSYWIDRRQANPQETNLKNQF